MEPPDRQGREEILTVHVTKKQLPLAPDVNLNVIAAATAGFTGYVIIANACSSFTVERSKA